MNTRLFAAFLLLAACSKEDSTGALRKDLESRSPDTRCAAALKLWEQTGEVEPGLQALIDESQRWVTGTVRLKLYKGGVHVVGRQSPHSLYSLEHVTFEEDTVYDQRDAEGFIKLQALRLRLEKAERGED